MAAGCLPGAGAPSEARLRGRCRFAGECEDDAAQILNPLGSQTATDHVRMCTFPELKARTRDHTTLVPAMQEVDLPLRYCDERVQALQLDVMQLAAGHLKHAKAAAGAGSDLQRFHVVLSDMCHSTLGVAVADVARSLHLARCAAGIAIGHSTLDGERGRTCGLLRDLHATHGYSPNVVHMAPSSSIGLCSCPCKPDMHQEQL
jgi:hypothetical protein